MGIKGIIFMVIALAGVIVNFSSRRICEKFGGSELKIKLYALAAVFIAVTLLMIFGK